MYQVHINGKDYVTHQDKKLLRYLRDDLRLTSVKDGCSEGACGTCTVIVDGKATRACIPALSKLAGKEIITVEGLTKREQEVYSYAFGKVGAVQCGFCIPGMIMSAKAVIDQEPDPTIIQVIAGIRTNICRCTGYKKIIEGILLAAKLLREGTVIKETEGSVKVGEGIQRIDAKEKVLGYGKYTDDIYIEGMIYGGALRSKYPRAKVVSIDFDEALKLPGVIGIYTAADIPGNVKIGHLKKDWDVLIPIGENTHYLGDAICLVAAKTPEILEEAKTLIKVEYEELEPVFDPFEAMKNEILVHKEGNVLAHEHLIRGEADKVIEAAPFKVTNHYETPWTEHAFLEPETAVSMPFDDGVLIYSSDQGTYDTRQECAHMLGLSQDKVVVENMLVGGGFGGKEDMSVQHHAALLAYLTGEVVKVSLTRAESLQIHPKRHPMWMDVTTACDEEGNILALKAKIISDTGAYASLGGPVLQRACTHAAGPYHFGIIDIEGTAIYTNNPPAGAFRGFGVTQTCFASEMNLNQLAQMVGISPWEIRRRNAILPGEELPNGQIADDSTSLLETLMAVKDTYENEKYAGLACAMKNAGVGVGIPDWGRCKLFVVDGKVEIHAGASGIGQGLGTVLIQMLSDVTKLPVNKLSYKRPNTSFAPDSGTTSGSRQTLVTGEALVRAAKDLVKDLEKHSLEQLDGNIYYGEYLAKTDPMGADKKNPVSHVAYGYATQLCVLNEDGTLKEMVAAHGVGKAVNPVNIEGQIEGGVVMSMGYALTEKFPLKEGRPKIKFGTLGLFKADKVPKITSIIVEKAGVKEGFGAIGIGEITSIPTAPAIAGAYYALTNDFETVLPLVNTPYSKKEK